MENQSITREEDRKERLEYLSLMKQAILEGNPITARMCGETSKQLADRINNHNYSQADAWLAHEKKVLGYNPK